MKPNMIAAAALAMAVSAGALANFDEEQMAAFESDCYKYAQEDGVAEEQLEDYVAQCVRDLVSAQSETADSEPVDSDQGATQE